MSLTRFFWIPFAIVLVLGGCSGDEDRDRSQDRSSPSPASADTSAVGRGDLSSFSGRIAFDNFEDVWTIDADGADLTQLTRAPYPEFDPSWSPDGTEIAFRSERSGEPEIWIMNADGTGQRRLTDGLSPAWSPDGSLIAFSGVRGSR
jgi:TolB protein